MENQDNFVQKDVSTNSKLSAVIMTAVITSVIVGLAMYWFMKDGSPISVSPSPSLSPSASIATSSNTPEASKLKTYTDESLGISFQYPIAWGDASFENYISKPSDAAPNARGKTRMINFSMFDKTDIVSMRATSSNYIAYADVSYKGTISNFASACPKQNVITKSTTVGLAGSGIGYCKILNSDGTEILYSIGIGTLPEGGNEQYLIQRMIFNLSSTEYSGFDFFRVYKNPIDSANATAYMQSIMNRTAPSDLLMKIDEFEELIASIKML